MINRDYSQFIASPNNVFKTPHCRKQVEKITGTHLFICTTSVEIFLDKDLLIILSLFFHKVFEICWK